MGTSDTHSVKQRRQKFASFAKEMEKHQALKKTTTKRAFSTNKNPRHEKMREKNTNLLHWLLKSGMKEKKKLVETRCDGGRARRRWSLALGREEEAVEAQERRPKEA